MNRRPLSASRRDLLRLLPAGLGVGLLGGLARPSRAAAEGERRFLFIFADGGWDPSFVFHTAFDSPYVDMPPDGAELAEVGDLRWVSGPTRPNVDAFFTRFGDRAAILNGVEVRSIAHERCRRILLTGSSDPDSTDIPSQIGAASAQRLPLSHVVISGPAFQNATSEGVVRIGQRGQLAGLLSGSCVEGSEPIHTLPSPSLVALEDAYVRARAQSLAQSAQAGVSARIHQGYADALADIEAAAAYQDVLNPSGSDSLSQLLGAVDLLEAGVARCAIVADLGLFNGRWDHHSEITRQTPSFQGLFGNLSTLMERLTTTPGTWGPTLADEITVVVFSEMGRYPSLNQSMGKDHWMTTSMLFLGGGIRGGQVVGAYSETVAGTPLIPETGELDPDGSRGGQVPQPSQVGATLMHLAGMDPAEAFGADTPPLLALLDE
jgi:uncharacterized protein (DUF1501 family)